MRRDISNKPLPGGVARRGVWTKFLPKRVLSAAGQSDLRLIAGTLDLPVGLGVTLAKSQRLVARREKRKTKK